MRLRVRLPRILASLSTDCIVRCVCVCVCVCVRARERHRIVCFTSNRSQHLTLECPILLHPHRRPTLSSLSRTRLGLLQAAVSDKVYLVDMVNLDTPLLTAFWKALLNAPDVTVVGVYVRVCIVSFVL